ncbi:MAG: hypothetical protein C5B46_01030 [Proteobacteria bacterium]|nr:MAG: hypothetical protein C5B46_01030 [Pseudomonadota bacterium]
MPTKFDKGHVQLWTCALDGVPPFLRSRLSDLLTPDEQERARRFRFSIHRDRYIACRAALRTLLGTYLGIVPRDVQLVHNAHGKPALNHSGAALTFNLAHCEGFALLAFGYEQELGVDVENVTRTMDYEGVAGAAFSAEERATLLSLYGADRAAWFFRCWTLREAYLKGVGTGFAARPSALCMHDADDRSALMLRSENDESEHWELRAIDLPAPYVGAIATRAALKSCKVSAFQWDQAQRYLPVLAEKREPRPSRADIL